MVASLSVFCLLAIVSVAVANPTLLYKCGKLDSPFQNYVLAKDIVVDAPVCFDIVGDGITLDGNGFKITATPNATDSIGVKYSGLYATVKNMNIANFKTGVLASGQYGKVQQNTLTNIVNGVDVTATHNEVSNNTIRGTRTTGTSAGVYVYFPATAPTEAFMSITDNVISDIQGDDFALGVSVYYATSIIVAHNRIFNLRGAVTEEVSVIGGEVEIRRNVFAAPVSEPVVTEPAVAAALLTAAVVLASAAWFYRTPSTPPASSLDQKQKEKEQHEGAQRSPKEEKKRPLSFQVASSPSLSSASPSLRSRFSLLSSSTSIFNPLSSSNPLAQSNS